MLTLVPTLVVVQKMPYLRAQVPALQIFQWSLNACHFMCVEVVPVWREDLSLNLQGLIIRHPAGPTQMTHSGSLLNKDSIIFE